MKNNDRVITATTERKFKTFSEFILLPCKVKKDAERCFNFHFQHESELKELNPLPLLLKCISFIVKMFSIKKSRTILSKA